MTIIPISKTAEQFSNYACQLLLYLVYLIAIYILVSYTTRHKDELRWNNVIL